MLFRNLYLFFKGHYWAIIWNEVLQEWIKFDDCRVYTISIKQMLDEAAKEAYVFLYEKI